MKKLIFWSAVMLIAGTLSGAEKIFEINAKAEITMPRSVLLGFSEVGFERFAGYRFDRQNSYLQLEAADKMPGEFTVAATAVLPVLPERESILFLRPGFHNVLSVNAKGEVVLSLWFKNNATGKFDNNIKLSSKRTVRPGDGRFFRVAFSVARTADGKHAVKLYLDGAPEAEKVIDGESYGYSRVFYVGGVPESVGKNINGFNGIIRSFVFYDGVLSDDEIASLR